MRNPYAEWEWGMVLRLAIGHCGIGIDSAAAAANGGTAITDQAAQ